MMSKSPQIKKRKRNYQFVKVLKYEYSNTDKEISGNVKS